MEIILKVIVSAAVAAIVGTVMTYLLWELDTRRIIRQMRETAEREMERMERFYRLKMERERMNRERAQLCTRSYKDKDCDSPS
jgi:L-cystine uptake protein TcyP (sodium:dicarboxylate symporter family)